MQCVPFFLYVNRSLLFCRLFSGWTERRAGWTAVRLLKGSGRRLWTVLARPGQPPSTNQTSTKQMSSGFFCLWKAPRNTKKGQSRSRPNAPSGKARSLIPFHCSSLIMFFIFRLVLFTSGIHTWTGWWIFYALVSRQSLKKEMSKTQPRPHQKESKCDTEEEVERYKFMILDI